jgi:acyl dehydratase
VSANWGALRSQICGYTHHVEHRSSQRSGAEEQVLTHGRITADGVAKLRQMIGHELRQTFRFNTEITHDNVRHYCWGIGDDNPLWMDPEYASGTDYMAPAAPPGYLWTLHPTWVQIGLPGVHGFHSGSEWTFHRPILQGDRPKLTVWLQDVVEKKGRFGGNSVILYFRTLFANAQDQVLADVLSWSFRIERHQAREKEHDPHAGIEMKCWTLDELAPVEEAQVAERPRGKEDRFWEDVEVGEKLDPVVKGPLCLTDMIAWYTGSQPVFQPAHEVALKWYRRHPMWAYRNPLLGNLEPSIRVHEDIATARAAGLPAPYDVGIQRHQWLFHLLTNWAGDAGFVKSCRAEYRKFNFYGDVQWLSGEVTGKRVDDDGDHVVDLNVWSRNQRDENTMPGTAVVALPTHSGHRPVRDRLAKSTSRVEYLASAAPGLVSVE